MDSKSDKTGLTLLGVLAFAAPQIPIAALQLALTVHLPRYFASHMGLSLMLVGSAFAIVRALDIPIDPLLGMMMDRTRTRLGRYRVWALAATPLLMISLYLLLRPVGGGIGEAYLVAVLLIMYLGYSGLYLAQVAWVGTLAPSYQARSRLFAVLTVLGLAGAVAVLVIPVMTARAGVDDSAAVEAMIWCVIAALPVTTLLMCALTPERIVPDHAPHAKASDYWAVVRRPNVLRLMASDFFIELGPGWMAALYLFYFTTKRGFSNGSANLLLLVYLAAGLAGAPAVSWFAGKVGKHRALMVCTCVYAACLAVTPVLPAGQALVAAPLMFVAGAMFAGFSVMRRALTADIADETRLHGGRECLGLLFALTNATSKLATAGAIFFTFRVLAYVGFNAHEGAANTASALRGLELAFLAGPIVFVTLGGFCFLGYALDSHRHADIRRQLDARDLAAL